MHLMHSRHSITQWFFIQISILVYLVYGTHIMLWCHLMLYLFLTWQIISNHRPKARGQFYRPFGPGNLGQSQAAPVMVAPVMHFLFGLVSVPPLYPDSYCILSSLHLWNYCMQSIFPCVFSSAFYFLVESRKRPSAGILSATNPMTMFVILIDWTFFKNVWDDTMPAVLFLQSICNMIHFRVLCRFHPLGHLTTWSSTLPMVWHLMGPMHKHCGIWNLIRNVLGYTALVKFLFLCLHNLCPLQTIWGPRHCEMLIHWWLLPQSGQRVF